MDEYFNSRASAEKKKKKNTSGVLALVLFALTMAIKFTSSICIYRQAPTVSGNQTANAGRGKSTRFRLACEEKLR